MKKETNTPSLSERKAHLKQQSSRYREALNTDLNDLRVDLRRWGRTFLIVGGSLYGVYKIVKLMRNSGSEGEALASDDAKYPMVTKPIRESVVVTKIKEQIAMFLLAIAMQKIRSFINNQKDEKAGT